MIGDRAHGIVGDARGEGAAYPGGVGEKGVETAIAAVVEVDIYSSIVSEHEIAD